MPHEVRTIRNDLDRDRCYLVRNAVFVEEQAVPPWEELDEFDEAAQHFAAEADERIVGTARLVDCGGGVGKLGRVAVLKEYRGRGIGRDLVRAAVAAAAGRYRTVMLDAQLDAIAFYERLGFIAEGDVFLDAGIEHRKMTLVIEG